MKKNITVIGDGGWGTALAMVLDANGNDVTVWGPFPEYIDTIRRERKNINFLPGIQIPESLQWTADASTAAINADLIVIAVPTKFYRSVMESFAGYISPTCLAVSATKGLDKDTHKRMTEVAAETLKLKDVAAISGPSHAEEVARNIPTAVTIASRDPEHSAELQTIFSNRQFRAYTSDDVIGVELGGALKNVIAVAVGVSDGLSFGDNTRAALITRGLSEIMRLGCALGARHETFSGLSGMGDLIVTCTSGLSRNRAVGERLGKGENIDDILNSMKQVAEGVWNCASARSLARSVNIEAPITEEVFSVIHDGKNPLEAVESLLSRDVKPEN